MLNLLKFKHHSNNVGSYDGTGTGSGYGDGYGNG